MDLLARVRRHWWTAARVFLAVAVLAVVLVMLSKLGTASKQLNDLRSQQTQQSKAVSLLSSNLADAQQQLKAHGITPTQPPPAQIIAQAGPQGAQGPAGAQGPGPSDAQVAAAVAVYMSTHPVPPGATGPGASLDQIAAAVTAYLKANPPAPGPTGAAGATGPGPTDSQVANAVAIYMASHPVPAGPAGASGSPGKDGAQGAQGVPGPAGATGPAPSGWTFTDQGVTYNCLPDNQTPGPHYTCTAQSPSPSPSPSPSTSPSGGTPSGPRAPASLKAPGHTQGHQSLFLGVLLFGVYADRRILAGDYLT